MALEAAEQAQKAWNKVPAKKRADVPARRYLRTLHGKIHEES